MPSDTESTARQICSTLGLTFDTYVKSGAFKDTYRVVDASGTPLALKVYRDFPAERTLREIQAMQRCSHTNIAKLTTALGSFDGVNYSIEEFIGGGSLATRLAASLLSRAEVIRMGGQLINGLAHIAALELVHRDLKPDNIMFREDGSPVVVDFGIVRNLVEVSLTSSWMPMGPGTPFFAPAEQLRNEKPLIDWRADQFALGVVLSLCLLGKHPYAVDGEADDKTVQRVANKEPHPAAFISASGAAGFSILAKMTSAWPIDRFRTPEDLSAAWALLEE